MIMGEYDTIGDVLYDLYNYLIYPFWYEFRRFLFLGENREVKLYVFVAIPLIFLSIEALFDFILPTLLNCQPLFIRRFFIPKAERFNLPEAKQYKLSEGKSFKIFKTPTLFIKHSIIKPFSLNKKYESLDLKYYRSLYCQRYNRFPKPLELKKFALSESKSFNERKFYQPYRPDTHYTLSRFKKLFGKKDNGNK